MEYSEFFDEEPKRLRALIVDDSTTSRLALMDILSEYMDCDVAADGEDALRVFTVAWEHGQPYGLICLDIMMPRIDGLQVLKMIRRMERGLGIMKEKAVKIIMISAVKNPMFIFEAHRGGANAYLYKPINKSKILEELKKLSII